MDKLLQQQNKTEGVDNMTADQMDSTVGSVLSFLKSQGVDVESIKKAVPQADTLLEKAEADNAAGGGGLVGKLGGLLAGASPNVTATSNSTTSKDAASVSSMPALLSSLQAAGVSPQQAQSALPLVAGMLKDKAGVDAFSVLGLEASSSSGGGGGGVGGFLGNLLKKN